MDYRTPSPGCMTRPLSSLQQDTEGTSEEPQAPDSLDVASWRQKNELTIGDAGRHNEKPGSSISKSSVINDGGDSRQLAETSNISPSEPRLDNHAFSDGLDLSHIGGGRDLPGPQSDRDFAFNCPKSHPLEHESSKERPGELENVLRAARIAPRPHSEGFIPFDELDCIITPERVKEELRKLPGIPEGELDKYTAEVWGAPTKRSKVRRVMTRRKIFGILALLGKPATILDFVNSGFHDNILPLELIDSEPGKPRLAMKTENGEKTHLTFCLGWDTCYHDAFFKYQWWFKAPWFQFRTEPQHKLKHYNLEDNVVLPEINTKRSQDSARQGGFGDVYKVEFHPSHHNMSNQSSRHHKNPLFAVKKLKQNDEKAFKEEVKTLQRLGSKPEQPHLVRLLATYHYRNEYYLVFPWADGGNLRDLWEQFPHTNNPARGPPLALWVIGQITGLVEGLREIHTCELDDPSRRDKNFDSTDAKKKHGAHGDLKPENILWFKGRSEDIPGFPMGCLKITDFGLTSFHESETLKMFEPKGISQTYCDPEFEVNGVVSGKYDMWTLGCVLTEFVTWYILGLKGVSNFEASRVQATPIPRYDGDNFFSMRNGSARLKRSVKEHFEALRWLAYCGLMLDLIDFIEDHLLRMEPEKRCDIKEAASKLTQMRQKCEDDNDYCTELPEQIPPRRATNLSELSELSPRRGTRTPGFRSPTNSRVFPEPTPRVITVAEGSPMACNADEGSHAFKGKEPEMPSIEGGNTPVSPPNPACPSPLNELDEEHPQFLTQDSPLTQPVLVGNAKASIAEAGLLTAPQNPHGIPTSSEDQSRRDSYVAPSTQATHPPLSRGSQESLVHQRIEKAGGRESDAGCIRGLSSLVPQWLTNTLHRLRR
ncbi:hypothetical protein DL764_000428 [Monosporascus ibericus]|uniref:Protein kinase domain-containing protein n=1 Tax=Monosporascus ibericus TaxID=155417 RepID=A0A4Q4TTI2_9PEZI|nr:hypothetical protein DL764_000428 [Monosporascus ibericus]